MAEISTDALDKLIQESLTRWSIQVEQKLKASLRKNKIVLTEQTLQTLQTRVLQGAGAISAKMQLSFQDSGRIRDMRKVQYKNLPPIEVLEDYVKEVGLQNFNYVPGYLKGNSPLSQERAINRIAWGIAVNRRDQYVHKPSRWFNKTFYASLNELIDDITTEYQKTTGQILAAGFKNT